MSSLRLYPHRIADPESIRWDPWWIERGGGRVPLETLLKGWDYACHERVGISLEINAERFFESTGISDPSSVAIVVMADCRATQDRLISRYTLPTDVCGVPLHAPLELPPGRLAESVRLSAHLVLATSTNNPTRRVAASSGARLHSSPELTVQLEGTAGRFPAEALSFASVGRTEAPWSLQATYEDLSESFLGSMRLLINTDHPAGQQVASSESTPAIDALLKADTLRLVISNTAKHALDEHPTEYEDGSIGRVLDTMCRNFLGRSLERTASLYTEDPIEFEAMVQTKLNPLATVVKA